LSKRREPEWRDRSSADLLLRHLAEVELSGPALVIEDPLEDVAGGLTSAGHQVMTWNRRVRRGKGGDPWPPSGPFALAALRLPRGKDELVMSLHAAASVLLPGGSILVYGAKDEGIQGALGSLEDLFADPETVAIGGHCRVLKGVRRQEESKVRTALGQWRIRVSLDHPDLPSSWVSYPGVFAHGRLDEGTRLLMGALPSLPRGARVLDYGCGSGVVGYVARSRGEEVTVELLDVDAVALEAARENVPGCVSHLHEGLPPKGFGPYDAIFSNPPFHKGKAEDPEMIISLVRGAPALLGRRGILVFVAQRRLSLEGALQDAFRDVTVLAQDSTFRVWKGQRPKRGVEHG
jgi:16S rRNA (guanine1207-N2)-methyltransferase